MSDQTHSNRSGAKPQSRRELRAHAHELRWGPWAEATIRGDHDVAAEIAREADELDDLADLIAARAWRPSVRVPDGSPFITAAMYDEILERIKPTPVRRLPRPPCDSDRSARYAEAALDGECQRVADTPSGNRNNVLASASFKVGQLLCEDDDAYERLLTAALDAGLSEREARPTIRSGLRAGCAKPSGSGEAPVPPDRRSARQASESQWSIEHGSATGSRDLSVSRSATWGLTAVASHPCGTGNRLDALARKDGAYAKTQHVTALDPRMLIDPWLRHRLPRHQREPAESRGNSTRHQRQSTETAGGPPRLDVFRSAVRPEDEHARRAAAGRE